jgi:hypothetical protein
MNGQSLTRLTSLLNSMDLPVMRMDPLGDTNGSSNLTWLLRNIHIKNKDHPDLKEATRLLAQLVREGK